MLPWQAGRQGGRQVTGARQAGANEEEESEVRQAGPAGSRAREEPPSHRRRQPRRFRALPSARARRGPARPARRFAGRRATKAWRPHRCLPASPPPPPPLPPHPARCPDPAPAPPAAGRPVCPPPSGACGADLRPGEGPGSSRLPRCWRRCRCRAAGAAIAQWAWPAPRPRGTPAAGPANNQRERS